MKTRGFTLVELMVALILLGLVSGTIYQILLSNQRAYRRQTEQVDLNTTVRTAVTVLPSEMRELNAGDPVGSDVIMMADSSVRYKAARGLYFLCQRPAVASTKLVFWQTPSFAARSLKAGRDSLLIYAENDSTIRGDNQWLHAAITTVGTGSECPLGALSTGAPSIAVNVNAGVPLAGVQSGAPVRSFEVVEVLTYPDVYGRWWMGVRGYDDGAWSALQPLVGPVTADGLRLRFLDLNGAVTADPTRVARVGIAVTGESMGIVADAGGYAIQALSTEVALRNNPRF